MVAMACNWLPHNLNEVAQAIYDYLDGKEPMLPGPDFPTGGIIINKNDVPMIMRTGHGSVKVRGKYIIEKNKIIFTEVPYGIGIEALLKDIGEACDNKEIEGISDIRNESNKKGLRLVFECDKDADPAFVVKKLFAKTNLQTSISYNQVALVDKVPTELNLKQAIEIYVEHNLECLKRTAERNLNLLRKKENILNGLIKAMAHIDDIIALIKSADSPADAREKLIDKYGFDNEQAKAIVDLKLARLTKLEAVELNNELESVHGLMRENEKIINDNEYRKSLLVDSLKIIVKRFGDARRTELAQIEVPKETKEVEEVPPEDVVVITTQTGFIKRVPTSAFKVQKKNGKGVKSEDDIQNTISTNTVESLMVFTNFGKMYKLNVADIPVGSNTVKGSHISTLIKSEPNEKIICARLYSSEKYVLFFTKNGVLKKTSMEEFTKIKRGNGIIAIKLGGTDNLVNIEFVNDEDVILITKQGMSIHFTTKDIAPIGRVAIGVRAIKLNDGDEVLTGIALRNKITSICMVTETGYGKQVAIDEFTLQGRNGKGIIAYNLNNATGSVVAAIPHDGAECPILLTGKPTSICINSKDMPILKRTAFGNQLIKGSKVTSMARI